MALLFDMPIEKLETYGGTNPRPEDFDDFWDQALAEMTAIDPQVELVPAEFQTPFAECFHMYFTGVGNARIHAKLMHPKAAPEPHAAVLMFHGYSADSGNWMDKLGYVSAGFTVAALDCRGQGGLSHDSGGVRGTTFKGHIVRGLDDSPDKLLYRGIFLDTAQLAGLVMDMSDIDPARVVATGSSQGGGLTLACASLEPRIARIAPAYPFLCDYKRVWEIEQARDAYEELMWFFKSFDPRHEREDEIFNKLGYIDVQYLTPRIRAKTMMAVGLMDTVCPPSTQFAAYNRITSEKETVVYPDYGHEGLPDWEDMVYRFLTGV